MTALNVKNRTLFTHDNLQVMRGINSETVDLIYLDPLFNSKRNYAAPIESQAAGAAFSDTWSLDDIKKRVGRNPGDGEQGTLGSNHRGGVYPRREYASILNLHGDTVDRDENGCSNPPEASTFTVTQQQAIT